MDRRCVRNFVVNFKTVQGNSETSLNVHWMMSMQYMLSEVIFYLCNYVSQARVNNRMKHKKSENQRRWSVYNNKLSDGLITLTLPQ